MIIGFVTGSAIVNEAKAQDPHFSQYFTSPMTVNPSLIGKDVADWRAAVNLRSQWWGTFVNPYNTRTVSIEKRIAQSKSSNDNMAIGLSVLSDQSNDNILKNNFVSAGFAYNKSLNGDGSEQIGVGLSFTYANRLLDQSKFQFESQFGSMGFQREMPSGEAVVVSKNNYFEVNAGVNYSKNNANNGFRVGAGYFHASRPKVGAYTTNQYSVDARLSLQGSAWFMLPNKHEIHISSNSEFQGAYGIFTLGGVYKIKIAGDETLESLNLGCFKRFSDAVYPYAGLEAKKWLIAISYDAVTTNLKTNYNSVQSLELSMVWQFASEKSADKPNGRPIYY